ncbi:MAG: hypothetical protein L6Q98_24205 [Anaerolineae bacterium]|nr:hypothetical protein [Anaerolineae bacterium]NUQ06691.1 hypothetical protein [Anaerolineae bacterium]
MNVPSLNEQFSPSTLLTVVLQNHALLIDLLFDLLQRIPAIAKLPGIYEVLAYEAELELLDTKGKHAVYRKRQEVRFIQDNIIAYQDTAWGDGDIFASYRCSPGAEVDRYREGSRYHVLISLRETKNRNDNEVIHVERGIRNGFVNATEEFQVDIDHRTRLLCLRLVLPGERVVRQVTLIEQHGNRTVRLSTDHRQMLPDGRCLYRWTTTAPRMYETYILRWEW